MRRMRPVPLARTLLTCLALVLSIHPAFADANAVRVLFERFQTAYEGKDAAAYAALFTLDFRFRFGDADLRATYPQGWGRDDEVRYAGHLFNGFVTAAGEVRPAAQSITLELGMLDVRRDPEHPCDPEHYALVDAPCVVLRIAFQGAGEVVAPGHHAFWLVRNADGGEAPAGWSIRRWIEEPDAGLLVAAPCDSDSASGALALAGVERPLGAWTIAPNPSRRGETARLSFEVPRAGDRVEAEVYDVAGRHVATLARGPSAAGWRTLSWDGHDERGRTARAGVYFVRVRMYGLLRRERVVRIP